MVDVGDKTETAREAVASAAVRMSRRTLALALGRNGKGGRAAKGDVLATARLAAITALKRTHEWIPLCHPVRLVGSDVDLRGDTRLPGIRVRVTARAFDRTGVEMEALVGAAAAALTIYDMVKGSERGVEILSVRLEEKSGGRTGTWRRAGAKVATRLAQPTSKEDKDMDMATSEHVKICIIGSGPAGYTAAIYARARESGAGSVRGGRRGDRAVHSAGRPTDDHHRGRELSRVPQGRPGTRADGAVQGPGRAVRNPGANGGRDRR